MTRRSRRKRRSQSINEFLTRDLLTQAEPAKNAVEDHVSLLEVLDRAAAKVGQRFADQAELETALRATIAQTYHGLASWEKAEAQWRSLLEAARQRNPESADSYQVLAELAHILRHRGRTDAETVKMAETAAAGLERTLGPDHANTLSWLDNLALAYRDAGKLPDAIALFERVREAMIAQLGPDHPTTLKTLNNLAGAYWTARRLPEAIALFEQVRDAMIAKLGPDHPDTLTTLNNLALTYQATGKLPDAIALFERVRDAMIAQLGPDHRSTLNTLENLAAAYRAAGKLPEAIAQLERVRDAKIARLGPDDPDTLTTLQNLAATYWSVKQFDKSVPLFEDVLKRREAKLGRQHPGTQLTVANLGVNYQDSGRLDKAIPLLEEAYRAAPAPEAPLGRCTSSRCLRESRPAGRGRHACPQNSWPTPGRPCRKTVRNWPTPSRSLRFTLLEIGAHADAEPILRECLAIREKRSPMPGPRSTPGPCSAGPCSARRSTSTPSHCLSPAMKG